MSEQADIERRAARLREVGKAAAWRLRELQTELLAQGFRAAASAVADHAAAVESIAADAEEASRKGG